MKLKPILFNGEMVRAILDERKTVTRRVIKGIPTHAKWGGWLLDSTMQEDAKDIGKAGFTNVGRPTERAGCEFKKPPCEIGDTLYVRETWKYYRKAVGHAENFHIAQFTAYKADDERNQVQKPCEWYEGNWKPSIHMPKSAARIFLRVTDVRVERLQDITEKQAKKEGCITFSDKIGNGKFDDVIEFDLTARDAFIGLWNSTLKKDSACTWAHNPYVWVIEFERCEKQVEESK